jgi:hypothetical protein
LYFGKTSINSCERKVKSNVSDIYRLRSTLYINNLPSYFSKNSSSIGGITELIKFTWMLDYFENCPFRTYSTSTAPVGWGVCSTFTNR